MHFSGYGLNLRVWRWRECLAHSRLTGSDLARRKFLRPQLTRARTRLTAHRGCASPLLANLHKYKLKFGDGENRTRVRNDTETISTFIGTFKFKK